MAITDWRPIPSSDGDDELVESDEERIVNPIVWVNQAAAVDKDFRAFPVASDMNPKDPAPAQGATVEPVPTVEESLTQDIPEVPEVPTEPADFFPEDGEIQRVSAALDAAASSRME